MLKVNTLDTVTAINAIHAGVLVAPRHFSSPPVVTAQPSDSQEGSVDTYCGSRMQVTREANAQTFNWIAARQAKNASVGVNAEYTVRPGDTVWSVLRAKGYSATEISAQNLVAKVARASGVMDANRPFPGQKLQIPAKAGQN